MRLAHEERLGDFDNTRQAWHIAETNRFGQPQLGHGDYRVIRKGEKLSVPGTIAPCEHGLHFCLNLIDCLYYANGTVICKVEIGKPFKYDGNKGVSNSRTVLDMTTDAAGKAIIKSFTFWCAREVMAAAETPEQIKDLLVKETQNPDASIYMSAIRYQQYAASNGDAVHNPLYLAAAAIALALYPTRNDHSTIMAAHHVVHYAEEAHVLITETTCHSRFNDQFVSMVEAEFAKQKESEHESAQL